MDRRTPRRNENGRGGRTKTLSYTLPRKRKEDQAFPQTTEKYRRTWKSYLKIKGDIKQFQKVKGDIKQFCDLVFRRKFSMSFLLDLEDFM